MLGSNCMCIYTQYIETPVTSFSIVLGLLISLIIIISGWILNDIFKKKLSIEKRNILPGRKGNVIEPIMRWYLTFLKIYWPYQMMAMWVMNNEIVPATWFRNCWLLNIFMNPVRVGRVVIAYNSFFVALIRYVYIVHSEKANTWEFQRVGRLFKISSIVFPICMEVIRLFTEENLPGLKNTHRFQTCMAINEGLNTTAEIVLPTPVTVALTMELIPRELISAIYYIYVMIVIVFGSNIVEAYMYLKMYQIIKR